MRKILLILFYLVVEIIFSQDTSFYFSGRVIDSETRLPISNAKVSLVGTFRKTFTNENGGFSILLRKNKSIVEISSPFFVSSWFATPMLVYPEQIISLIPKTLYKGLLHSKNNLAEKVQFNDTEWNLRDYSFYETSIFLLLHNKKTNQDKLSVLSETLKLLYEVSLKGCAVGILRDYEGKSEIIFEDKVEQFIYEEKKGIQFISQSQITNFEKNTYRYLSSSDLNNYYKFNSSPEFFADQYLNVKIKVPALTYYCENKKTKRQSLLKNISNEKSMKQELGEQKYTEIGLPRYTFNRGKVEYKELKAPVFKRQKNIYIFDLANRKIESYDSVGKIISQASFYFYPEDFWLQEFYQDYISQKFYTVFLGLAPDFGVSLMEISPETGKKMISNTYIGNETVSDIKVNNAFVYYFKKDSLNKNILVRVPINTR